MPSLNQSVPKGAWSGLNVTLAQARVECQLQGAALCSPGVAAKGICCRTGCKMDGKSVWLEDGRLEQGCTPALRRRIIARLPPSPPPLSLSSTLAFTPPSSTLTSMSSSRGSNMNWTRCANRKPAFDSAREAQCEALAPPARSTQSCGARCNALQRASSCSACWQPNSCNGCYYDCRASPSYANDSAALLAHAFPEAAAATLLERLSSRRLVFFGDSVTMQMVMSATCVLHRLAIAQDSETRHVSIRFTGGPYTPTPDGAMMHNLSCGTLDLRRQLPDRQLSNQSRRLRLSLCYVTWPVVHWDAKVQSTAFSASLKTSFEDVVQRHQLSRRDIVVVNAGVHMSWHKELLRKQVSSFVRSIDDHAANKPRVIWRETSAQFFSRMDHAKPWLSNGTVCEQRDTANTFNNITDPLLSHSSSIRVLRTWQLSDAAGGGQMKGYSRVGGGRMALDCTHLCMPSTVLDRWSVCLFKGLAVLGWLPGDEC